MIKIDITETSAELKELLKAAEYIDVRERIQVIYWIKSKQVKTTEAIALLLGKHRTTISRWLNTYRNEGMKALLTKEKSSGRNKIITPFAEESLKQKLKDKEQFSSYKEIQAWLQQEHGIEMSYTGVHHLIRYRLKEKLTASRTVCTKQRLKTSKNSPVSSMITSASSK
ncbi:MAG: helix-turn-helix domain-containing protein [Pleurocapsa sp. MO_226.B13]|nr:helix-turn-helix domain-containing protein [Pleurocapsa sp. MO_226.B13]